MNALTFLRRQRAWMVAALFLCLPWMAVNGRGGCPMQKAPAIPASCCAHCCPTPDQTPAPAPLPCCEAFKLYLNSEAALPKLSLEEIGVVPPWDGWLTLLAFASSEPPPFLGSIHDSEPPPGAFLLTVSRRCHPGNAPPSVPAI